MLYSTHLSSPIGELCAIANDESLLLLNFLDCERTQRTMSQLLKQTNESLTEKDNDITRMIHHELDQYFAGRQKHFDTPLHFAGSDFQNTVWHALCNIPHAQTRSYAELAESINKPTACRAVAQANAANRLAIIVPCHRVINSNGEMGGYAGGVNRKQWLLEHELRSVAKPHPNKPGIDIHSRGERSH